MTREHIPLEDAGCIVCSESRCVPVASGTDYEYDTTGDVFAFVRCCTCGHLYLNPRPAIGSASTIYPATYYTSAGTHRSGALGLLGSIKDAVLALRLRSVLASVPREGSILEIGCGDGALLGTIRRRRPDIHLTGLDLSVHEHARGNLAAQGISLIESSLEAAVLPGKYDLIIMNQLIEHLWDVRGSLGKLHGALSDAGRLSIATPNVDGWDYRFFRAGSWGAYYFPRHLNLFSSSSLARVLTDAGFRVTSVRPLVAPLVWVGTFRAVWKRKGWKGYGFFKDSNLPLLASFALLDRLMIGLGFWTSNQQLIAEKSSAPTEAS